MKNQLEKFVGITQILLRIPIYIIATYPMRSFVIGYVLCDIVVKASFIEILEHIILGFVLGGIIHIYIFVIENLVCKSYKVVQVRRCKKNREICARIKRIKGKEYDTRDSGNKLLIKRYSEDLEKIKEDYCVAGNHITTYTHALFVASLLKSLAGNKAAVEFTQEFVREIDNARIGTERTYCSEDEKLKITVRYEKDKVNTNLVVKKLFYWPQAKDMVHFPEILIKEVKEAKRELEKNATKVPYYKVSVDILK